MIHNFDNYLNKYQPDFLAGHNIKQFDLPSLISPPIIYGKDIFKKEYLSKPLNDILNLLIEDVKNFKIIDTLQLSYNFYLCRAGNGLPDAASCLLKKQDKHELIESEKGKKKPSPA
ncbi:hypothetical protein P9112_006757 [Eukaryota sp. TZLM1-RC]